MDNPVEQRRIRDFWEITRRQEEFQRELRRLKAVEEVHRVDLLSVKGLLEHMGEAGCSYVAFIARPESVSDKKRSFHIFSSWDCEALEPGLCASFEDYTKCSLRIKREERKRLDELERHRQMGLSAAWSEFAELEDGEEDASPPLKRHCAGRMLNWEGLQRVSLTERMGDRRREVLRTAARRKREAQARQEAQERRTRQMEAQEAERERKRAERERRKSEKEEDTRRRQEEKARAKKKREKEKARAKEEREKEKGRGSEDRWSAAEES